GVGGQLVDCVHVGGLGALDFGECVVAEQIARLRGRSLYPGQIAMLEPRSGSDQKKNNRGGSCSLPRERKTLSDGIPAPAEFLLFEFLALFHERTVNARPQRRIIGI